MLSDDVRMIKLQRLLGGPGYVMPGDVEVSREVLNIVGGISSAFEFVLEGGAIEVDPAGLRQALEDADTRDALAMLVPRALRGETA